MEKVCKVVTVASFTNESVLRDAMIDLNRAKKQMLENSVFALQEGDALLEKLTSLWKTKRLVPQDEAVDVKPELVKQSAALAIGQVSDF